MISVLTLNLRFGLAQDGADGWELRKDSLAAFLIRHPADFISFQEANDFQIDFLRGLLPGFNCRGLRSQAPKFWQHNIIFFRDEWQCVHEDRFFLSPTPDIPSRFRDSKWPRQCTLGIFQKGPDRLMCINTHFDFAPGVQADSARIILRQISSHPEDIPIILMGDFNAVPGSLCHRIFLGTDRNRPNGGRIFRDVFSTPYPATFHGFKGGTGGYHIDWILYTGPIRPIHHAAIQEKFLDRFPSDHYPILAAFEPEIPDRTSI